MDTSQFFELYKCGRRDFSGIDFIDLNLSDSRGKLENVSFRGANLDSLQSSEGYIRFFGCDFRSASVRFSYLIYFYPSDCNFSNSDFEGSIFRADMIIRDCDMSRSSFRNSRFLSSTGRLIEVNMCNVNLENAIINGITIFKCNLSYANLRGVRSREMKVDSTNLSYAILEGVNFHESSKNLNLSFADLRGARLHKVDLQGCDLSGADLRDTDLSDANLENADMTLVRLERTNLRYANLKGVRGLNSDGNSEEENYEYDSLSNNREVLKGAFLENTILPNGEVMTRTE
ncbi:pentapeptide repeat-containing protein [Baaleninema simplex]|uniref:pentapeptide repeat-containing protein n=1 Tax=Baaleninema simplex TaxID=2862350 RepID=UPI000347056A|nr:pentapeptide repeat-containing protein [Baaleninema simplex]